MDDLPDKLRRNVVVLSAAILAIAIFNLSFKPTGTLLGFAEVGNVSPFKVWFALAGTLFYVILRYHHAEDTFDDRNFVADNFRGFREQALIERLEAHIRRYFLRGTRIKPFDDFDEFIDGDILKRMERDGCAQEVDELKVGIVDTRRTLPWWQGQASVTFHTVWASGGSYGRSGGRQPAFTLSLGERLRTTVLALLRCAARSRTGVDVALPYTLASLAMLVCLYKLGFYFSH